MKIRKLIVIVSLVFLIPVQFFARDVEKEKVPVGIDFFAEIKSFSKLKVHNGEVFFILRQPDKNKNNYKNDLFKLADGKPLQLTRSGDVSDYFILNDDLIFKAIRESDDEETKKKGIPLTVYQKLTKDYQESAEWVRLPYNVNEIAILDDRHFFFTAAHDLQFDEWLEQSNGNYVEAAKKKEENKAYRVFDELPFWSNGRGDVNGTRVYLYYYNEGEIRKISSGKYEYVSSIELSPDKKTLVYTQREYETKAPLWNQLVSLNTNTFEKKVWDLYKEASYGGLAFAGNEEVVLTIDRSLELGVKENNRFYRLNTATGKISEVYSGEIYGLGNSIGSDIKYGNSSPIIGNSKGIVYLSTVVDRASLVQVDFPNGQPSVLTPDSVTVLEFLPAQDGYYVIAMINQQAGEIYHISSSGGIHPLTSVNKALFDEHQIQKPIEVVFKNDEGEELNGYVLPPVNWKKGEKYPAILTIHGGPKTAYGTVFFHEMQYLASRGYAVLFTNPRGSDGRGSKFADLCGKYGDIDYKDVNAFVDAAISQLPFIDGNRLGVTGGSYGGFLTNWIIGHTDRFKAAVSLRGISSWLSFSNTSDIGYSFTRYNIGTNAWENPQELWDKSPLKYADKVKTPTLFIHSDEDYRCWLVEGVQMYYALQNFNVPTKLVIFKNENHELSRSGKPKNRIKRLEEIIDWFDKYL